jgi:hypothetical protein
LKLDFKERSYFVILPISSDLCLCEPFADYLNLTVPKEYGLSVLDLLKPILDTLGCSEVSEGLFLLPTKAGTCKVSPRGQVMIFSASGGFLEALRRINQYGHYLNQFTEYPHRVSMLHATADFRLDAPLAIESIYQRASEGGIQFTRKSLNPLHVSRLTGKNSEGIDTGTVYLGSRKNSDVWAKCYDKRQERLAKGLPDCGPMLRIEIAVQSDVGATLRDASKPFDLFWHFASKSLVTPPANFVSWSPHGEGFEIEKRVDDFTTWQRLWGIIENSSDFKRVIDLATADYGSDAVDEISRLLRKRITLSERSMVASA